VDGQHRQQATTASPPAALATLVDLGQDSAVAIQQTHPQLRYHLTVSLPLCRRPVVVQGQQCRDWVLRPLCASTDRTAAIEGDPCDRSRRSTPV
jgi:hypothetical protein